MIYLIKTLLMTVLAPIYPTPKEIFQPNLISLTI